MEGRHAPPKAEHPYPNNPRVFKFWGAPWGRSFFRVSIVGTIFFGSLIAINTYVSYGQPNIVGMVSPTREEVLRRRDISVGVSKIMAHQLPMELVSRTDRNLQFDDGIKFNPLTDEALSNVKMS